MYIAAGVRTDCEKLIEEFIRHQSLRFKKFAEIWRSMRFSAIFLGRQTAKEMLEFIEECEQIALSFCLPPCNFQVQVGGLYLLYSLFVSQPPNTATKIRITIAQWKELMELMNYVIQGSHHDVHFVFRKLQALNAFYFVATGIVMGPDLRDIPSDDSVALKYREQKSSLSDLIDKDGIEQLTAIHQHYYKMKCALAGPTATHPEKSIDVIPGDLTPVMVKCVEEFEKMKDQKPPKGDSATSGKKALDPDWELLTKSKASKKMQIFSRKAKVSRARRHREAPNVEDSPTKTPTAQQTKKSAAKKKEAITAEEVFEEDETRALIINEETALDMPILVSKSVETNKQKDVMKKSKNMSKIISKERPKKKRKVMTNETSKINQEGDANTENTNVVSTQKDVTSPNVKAKKRKTNPTEITKRKRKPKAKSSNALEQETVNGPTEITNFEGITNTNMVSKKKMKTVSNEKVKRKRKVKSKETVNAEAATISNEIPKSDDVTNSIVPSKKKRKSDSGEKPKRKRKPKSEKTINSENTKPNKIQVPKIDRLNCNETPMQDSVTNSNVSPTQKDVSLSIVSKKRKKTDSNEKPKKKKAKMIETSNTEIANSNKSPKLDSLNISETPSLNQTDFNSSITVAKKKRKTSSKETLKKSSTREKSKKKKKTDSNETVKPEGVTNFNEAHVQKDTASSIVLSEQKASISEKPKKKKKKIDLKASTSDKPKKKKKTKAIEALEQDPCNVESEKKKTVTNEKSKKTKKTKSNETLIKQDGITSSKDIAALKDVIGPSVTNKKKTKTNGKKKYKEKNKDNPIEISKQQSIKPVEIPIQEGNSDSKLNSNKKKKTTLNDKSKPKQKKPKKTKSNETHNKDGLTNSNDLPSEDINKSASEILQKGNVSNFDMPKPDIKIEKEDIKTEKQDKIKIETLT